MEKLLTDYEKGLEAVKNIPKVYLGQEVQTPFGKGIVLMTEYLIHILDNRLM